MKNLIYLSVFLLIVACKSKTDKTEENTWVQDPDAVENNSTTHQDQLNTLVPDQEDGGMMLLGMIDKNGLQQEEFNSWFAENFDAHNLDTVTIEKIKPLLNDVQIKAFMGTWCEDSQREIPAFYKVLDAASFDKTNMELVAVSHDKDTPQQFEKNLDIAYVPTFIFYRDDKELGRFVEYAQENLEKDIFAILSGANYKHAYED